MNLFTITILAALLYIAYRIAGKFTDKRNSTEIFLDELNSKYKETEIPTPKKDVDFDNDDESLSYFAKLASDD